MTGPKRRNAHALAAKQRKAGPHEDDLRERYARIERELMLEEMYDQEYLWDDAEEWERNELAQDNEGYGDWEDEGAYDEYE